MNSHYTYLLLNIGCILFPLLLSFDKKVRFISGWKGILPGILLPGLLFISWDQWFAKEQIWGFNSHYLTGIDWGYLPMEEWFFFLTVPYACLFVYACLRAYLPGFSMRPVTLGLLGAMTLLTLVLLILFWDHWYTLIAAGGSLLCCGWVWLKMPNWRDHFLLSYFITLLPFLLVNGLLTSLPVVTYDDTQNMGIRIGSIPADDFLYHFFLFFLNVSLYERFKG